MEVVRYPARIFRDPEDEVRWLVHFRGLGGGEVGIWTEGDSLEHAREMAVECLSLYLEDGPKETPLTPREDEEMITPELPIAVALTIGLMRVGAQLSQVDAARMIGQPALQRTSYRDGSPELQVRKALPKQSPHPLLLCTVGV